MLRWLLPVIAALALLGSSVTAWAAAGFIGESECCCPVKKTCKCHDHDDDRDAAPMLKRCAGEATYAAPAIANVVMTPEALFATDIVVTTIATVHVPSVPDEPVSEPETPPI